MSSESITRDPRSGMARPSNTTKYIDDFLRSLRAERNCSEHTLLAYSKDLRKFQEFIGRQLSLREVDHQLVRAFLAHLFDGGLSKPSVARALASLRSFFRYLARENVVKQNPAKLVATPKLPK